MRYCPTCRTQYTDDTLRFCLQDGATLVERLAPDTPTVAFPETPTVVGRKDDSQVTSWRNEEVTRVAEPRPETQRSGSSIVIPIIAAVAAVFLLFVVAAIGIWIYLASGRVVTVANANTNTNNTNEFSTNTNILTSSPSPTPTAGPTIIITPTPFVTNTSTPYPSPTTIPDRPNQPVPRFVDAWKSMAEAGNLNGYMDNYAGTVDYYNRSGASRSFVRADKARAFRLYNSMRVNITNMSFEVSADGSRATAVFDKEWDFRGSRNSSGKVQTQLRLRNENGRWLITGERDLRVYYTR